ncbi:MAG: hypothetical protein ACFFCW_01910 [Candidatus Hodarchaeota archaeon]
MKNKKDIAFKSKLANGQYLVTIFHPLHEGEYDKSYYTEEEYNHQTACRIVREHRQAWNVKKQNYVWPPAKAEKGE